MSNSSFNISAHNESSLSVWCYVMHCGSVYVICRLMLLIFLHLIPCQHISGTAKSWKSLKYFPRCLPPDPPLNIITFNKLHLRPSVGPCRVRSIVDVSSVCCSLWIHERGWKGNYRTRNHCALWCGLSFPACLRQTLIGTSLLLCCDIHLVLATCRNNINKDKSGQPQWDESSAHISLLLIVSFHLLHIVLGLWLEKKKK